MQHLSAKELQILRAAHNLTVIFNNPATSLNIRNLARISMMLELEDGMDPAMVMPADAQTKLDAARFNKLVACGATSREVVDSFGAAAYVEDFSEGKPE